MALKSFLFVSILLAARTAPIAEAQLGLIGGILGLIHIQGTVFCSANGNMDVNGTATPAFPSKIKAQAMNEEAIGEVECPMWICMHCRNKKHFEKVTRLYAHYVALHNRLRFECGTCQHDVHMATCH